MLINRTHISHFELNTNSNVVAHPALVQLTGTWGNIKRMVAYFGLNMIDQDGDGSFWLTDESGKDVGQAHRLQSGNQLVFNKTWFDMAAA